MFIFYHEPSLSITLLNSSHKFAVSFSSFVGALLANSLYGVSGFRPIAGARSAT